jgi:hypothetical protein
LADRDQLTTFRNDNVPVSIIVGQTALDNPDGAFLEEALRQAEGRYPSSFGTAG